MSKNLPLTKILLSLAVISVVAVATVGGTFANFTATPTTISSNAFASGSLTMSRSGSGAIFSSAAMKIGDTATGSVTITNTGTLAGAYTLTGSSSGNAALAAELIATRWRRTFNAGELQTVENWLAALPSAVVSGDVRLVAARVWLAMDSG